MPPASDVMTMSLNQPETQALGSIADALAGSDPRLASMLVIFSRLAAGEEMPVREKIRARLGWQQAMLLLGAVISVALLNASGHTTCARSMGTACASPSIPQHAGAGRR